METQNVKDTVRQIFTEYLTANGHRKTPERYAILETIYSIDGHFDIDMLYSRMMDQENFRVSRATLYNTIILLINARLIIKHQFGTSSQYEKSYNRETHHHQICTQCGKVTEFQNEELQHAIENTKLSRFQLSHYSLYIYGLCRPTDKIRVSQLYSSSVPGISFMCSSTFETVTPVKRLSPWISVTVWLKYNGIL